MIDLTGVPPVVEGDRLTFDARPDTHRIHATCTILIARSR